MQRGGGGPTRSDTVRHGVPGSHTGSRGRIPPVPHFPNAMRLVPFTGNEETQRALGNRNVRRHRVARFFVRWAPCPRVSHWPTGRWAHMGVGEGQWPSLPICRRHHCVVLPQYWYPQARFCGWGSAGTAPVAGPNATSPAVGGPGLDFTAMARMMRRRPCPFGSRSRTTPRSRPPRT